MVFQDIYSFQNPFVEDSLYIPYVCPNVTMFVSMHISVLHCYLF